MTGSFGRALVASSLLLLAAPTAWATEGDTLGAARQQAQQDLDASLQELAQLRGRIASEKTPLAQKLNELGERLAAARRANDETLRAIDAGGLDHNKRDTEARLRQDELTYVGALLNEYALNLEAHLGVGEGGRYASVLAAAKDASANIDLTGAERLARQLDVVGRSIERLEDLAGGARFSGSAIDALGAVTDGRFAVVGPIAVFASTDGKAVGLALPQGGSAQPVVQPLEASFAAPIVVLIQDGQGSLPVDPTLGGALKEMVEKWNLIDVFRRGGPMMYPLLVVSILALSVILERALFILNEQRKRDPRALQAMFAAVEVGQFEQAVRAGTTSKDSVAQALAYALEHRERSLAHALIVANSNMIKRYRRGSGILDTAITIAPLLGLLGTVTGMMHSFSLIGGELSTPGAITGGIAEALIATAFGLVIAIGCLGPYNYLNNRVEQVRHEMEAASAQIELLTHPDRGLVNALGAAHTVVHGAA